MEAYFKIISVFEIGDNQQSHLLLWVCQLWAVSIVCDYFSMPSHLMNGKSKITLFYQVLPSVIWCRVSPSNTLGILLQWTTLAPSILKDSLWVITQDTFCPIKVCLLSAHPSQAPCPRHHPRPFPWYLGTCWGPHPQRATGDWGGHVTPSFFADFPHCSGHTSILHL